jgi:sugar/nucleoside kinase (ribokinase family)
MLLVVGDLVEDIVVELTGPINTAADTPARIHRRRGGSAANVAVAAASAGGEVRFVGQVGDDAVGAALVAEMAVHGIDVGHVRRAGVTGTIVAVVDAHGERSMLTDRRACVALDEPTPAWLDGVTVVHLPLYSFTGGEIADTARTLVGWSHERGIAVSLDLSSTTVLHQFGVSAAHDLVDALDPDLVLANDDEAAVFGVTGALRRALTIVKRGGEPAVVHRPDANPVEVAAGRRLDGVDTTGAGDAFAAGVLVSDWQTDPIAAVRAGHAAAARLLDARLASVAT